MTAEQQQQIRIVSLDGTGHHLMLTHPLDPDDLDNLDIFDALTEQETPP